MTSSPLIYTVTRDYSNGEASYSLNCAFLHHMLKRGSKTPMAS